MEEIEIMGLHEIELCSNIIARPTLLSALFKVGIRTLRPSS